MAGLIVFVQIVHYPLMGEVDQASFVGYQRAHMVRTGWVVIPPMMAELGTAVWLALLPPVITPRPIALMGLALLAVVWVSTALLQAPAHGRLVEGFDSDVHARLVRTNWIRTMAWLARLPVAVILLAPGA